VDVYQIYCNLKPGMGDLEFVERVATYLDTLQADGRLESYRILRAKLGLKPSNLREFIISLEFRDMAQLDTAFQKVATRSDPIEGLHHAVNSQVQDVFFALYRDFPDAVRQRGDEKF
jgi:hypothetical protein